MAGTELRSPFGCGSWGCVGPTTRYFERNHVGEIIAVIFFGIVGGLTIWASLNVNHESCKPEKKS